MVGNLSGSGVGFFGPRCIGMWLQLRKACQQHLPSAKGLMLSMLELSPVRVAGCWRLHSCELAEACWPPSFRKLDGIVGVWCWDA